MQKSRDTKGIKSTASKFLCEKAYKSKNKIENPVAVETTGFNGTNGDTVYFEKPSKINGFGTRQAMFFLV